VLKLSIEFRTRRLDKIEVLTYLLEKYVPSGRPESAPGWLVKTDLETEEKTRHLSYAKSEDTSKSEGGEARKEDHGLSPPCRLAAPGKPADEAGHRANGRRALALEAFKLIKTIAKV